MTVRRPYQMAFDGTASEVPFQIDNPEGNEFLMIGSRNKRTILSGDGTNSYSVADMTVNPRGSKNIIWSSEAHTRLGVAIPALTANQKKATGDHTANGGTGALDLSAYRNLLLWVVLTSFTGGSSPTAQFELDYLDDTGTPNSLTLWKPTASASAAKYLVNIGPGAPFAQSAAAADLAPTGWGAIAIPSGYTYYSIPLPVVPNGKFAWTIANTPTAVAWTAWLYGMN